MDGSAALARLVCYPIFAQSKPTATESLAPDLGAETVLLRSGLSASGTQLTCICACAYLYSMAKTKRVQILMEPKEFNQLERLARKRGSSVSDLLREAARAQYLVDVDRSRRSRAAQNFLSLPDVSLADWKAIKAELAGRHDKTVS